METITLQRTTANPSCTLGIMTCEKTGLSLYTLEAPLPKNQNHYAHMLLPPGEYEGTIGEDYFRIDDYTVPTPCLNLDRVMWFPKADILPARGNVPRSGLIYASDVRVDDYNLEISRTTTLAFLHFCRALSDVSEDKRFRLIITEDHNTMTFSPLTEFEAQKKAEEVAQKKAEDAILNEIANYKPRTLLT